MGTGVAVQEPAGGAGVKRLFQRWCRATKRHPRIARFNYWICATFIGHEIGDSGGFVGGSKRDVWCKWCDKFDAISVTEYATNPEASGEGGEK
jgi:hypothetical protein